MLIIPTRGGVSLPIEIYLGPTTHGVIPGGEARLLGDSSYSTVVLNNSSHGFRHEALTWNILIFLRASLTPTTSCSFNQGSIRC